MLIPLHLPQVDSACLKVGVGRSSFYRWLQRARDPSAPSKFKKFLAAVDAAKEAKRAASGVLTSQPASGKLSTGGRVPWCVVHAV